jgi:hypothetical protein
MFCQKRFDAGWVHMFPRENERKGVNQAKGAGMTNKPDIP